MTSEEHYTASEVWIDRAEQQWNDVKGDPMLNAVTAQACAAIAQAHATLAATPFEQIEVRLG